MTSISELEPGTKLYRALASRVLAVLSVGVDGYRVYVDAVPGELHSKEWKPVAATGAKQHEPVARAIAETLFHLKVDVPYAQ